MRSLFENGKEIHHDENVEWYTDMTVYKFISKDLDENGKVLAMPTKKPTIFLLSGGAFVNLHNQDELNPDYSSLHSSLKLATKLTHGGDYNVIWIRYDTATGADATMINKLFQTLQIFHPNNSSYTNGTESKVKLEYASLAAFRDFRVKFQTEVNTNASIDKNNVFVAGISAGAVLTLYSVFLDQDEIPSSLSYTDNSDNITTISTLSLITDGYPIPKIKGIIPMSGGSFYNDIFDYTSHSAPVSINLMHGTCDELINQNEGRVIYKFLFPLYYNDYTASRYPHIYGSKYIYNTLLSTSHQRTGFGQVIKGGHAVITRKSTAEGGVGAWDALDVPNYNTPPPVPNMSLPINQRDIVFESISNFMKRAMGESGYPSWTNHAYSVFPDVMSKNCLDDDQTLISPPLVASDIICKDVNMTASLKGVPSWATVSWTVSSNLLIVGPSNNTTLTYKSNGVSSGTGVISVNVSYGGQNITLSKSATITPPPTPMSTPSVSPSSYNTICSVNKSMNLTGLPALVDSIRWTASGNVGIVTQNEASVTYRRVSNSYSSGILYATVYTPCENKTFSFEISTYSTLSGHGIGIISDCETGLVEMIPTKLVPGSTVTFTTLFPNAANHGITGGEWDFTCGTIISGPTNYWIGTTLRSQITIKVNNNISWPCGEVTVRPISVCDNYLWKIQDTEYGTCSGGGGWSLLSYPNPASDELNIALSYNDDKLIHQKYVLEIVDVTGNVVSRSYIENGKQQIATNNLRPGNYKIIIHANDEIITGSFIINR